MELSQEEYERLLRRKDHWQIFLNLYREPNAPGRSLSITGRNVMLDEMRDPIIRFAEESNGCEVRVVEVRMSDVFDLMPRVRALLDHLPRSTA